MFALSAPGTDWASSHGIQAYPLGPGPGGGALGPGMPPNPNWGHEPVMGGPGGGVLGPGGSPSLYPNTNFTGQYNPNPQPFGGTPLGNPGAPSPFQNTNFTGQGNPNPQQSPEWGQIINWLMGRMGIGGGGGGGFGGFPNLFQLQNQIQQGGGLNSLFGGAGGGIYSR